MNDHRPLIGLTGRRKTGAEVSGLPSSFATIAIDLYIDAYAEAVTAAGGLPVYIPLHVDPRDYAGRLDALLLSGGADVEPWRYGAPVESDLYPPEPERDRLELELVDAAVERDLPILGICRGLQLLNVWGGGTLHQHLPTHARWDVPADERIDELIVVPDSQLHELYGERHVVNSLHHQAVDRVADGWIVSARSADGTVEALEWP